MASVDLRTLWMHVGSDLSDNRDFPLMTSLSRLRSKDGEVVKLAGGRRRVIRRVGRGQRWRVSIQALDRDDIGWLEDHIGDTMFLREDRGATIFGAYFDVDTDEHRYDREGNVSLTVDEVTATVAV